MPQLLNFLLSETEKNYGTHEIKRPFKAGTWLAEVALVIAAYYAGAWLGFLMAIPPGLVTPVWVPSGIALAAILIARPRVWPGILLGSLLINFPTLSETKVLPPAFPALTAFAIAAGSVFQALVGAVFIRRIGRVANLFDHVLNIFKFVWTALAVCIISPSIGTTSLLLAGYISKTAFPYTWWTWWTGDLVGILAVTPLILIWAQPPRKIRERGFWKKAAGFFIPLIAMSLIIFAPKFFDDSVRRFLLPYLLVPFVVWAAFRFGKRGVTFSTSVISALAVWGTLHSSGPFAKEIMNESFLLLQPFIAILSVTGLVYSAALHERRGAYEELKGAQQNLIDFIENAPVGLHWVGPNGIIIWANTAELRMLGYTRDEYVGHHYSEFHVGETALTDMLERLKNHEELQNYEIQLRCKDGSIKDVILSCNVLWKSDTFIHTRCFTRDITERKKMEDALTKAHAKLELRVLERTQELFDAYKALEQEMAERFRVQKDILEISEREQKRIGQDLHDGIAQQLTGLSYMSKTLQYKLASREQPEAQDVGQILELIKHTIEDTRRISRSFYPVELEKLGLFPALKELAMNFEKMFSVHCKFKFDPTIKIAEDAVAAHLYRMTQEAVSNAMKHGKPKLVQLSMERVDGGIALKIEDDGVGIDEKKLESKMGLRIMNYRSKMIGANFAIQKRPEGGTRVSFTFKS